MRPDGRALPRLVTRVPGPRSKMLAARLARVENPAFESRREARAAAADVEQAPIVYAEGRGSNVVDVDGNVLVDLCAGFGALALGHGAVGPTAGLFAQAERLWQALGDVYASDAKVALLERLAAMFHEPGARVMLGQSGADAVTAALKTAVLATGRPGVVAMEGAYHGLSYGPLAACGYHEGFRAPFAEQLSPHVRFVPFPSDAASLDRCLGALEAELAKGDVGAVLFEPVLGRGGCVPMAEGAAAALVRRARAAGALSIADEIWTGLGRGGAMALTRDARPDMMLFGKALGGGLPLSACVARGEVMQAWARGGDVVHTATFHGAPLACATALATLDAIERGKLAERALASGSTFRAALSDRLGGRARDVRGVGLMVGVELASGDAAQRAVRGMLARGYIVLGGGPGGRVLTLTPALTIPDELLDAAASALAEVV